MLDTLGVVRLVADALAPAVGADPVGGVEDLLGGVTLRADEAVTVAVTSDLTGRVNAADLARAAVIAMGGQGAGGKPDFAQGGAPDGSKADDGLASVRAALAG